MRRQSLGRGVLVTLGLFSLALPARLEAQAADDQRFAKRRLFESAGAGLQAVRRDAAGHYYVLTAPGSSVLVFNASGQLLKKVPPDPAGKASAPARTATIVFGEDMDVDGEGRIFVADRGANAVRIYSPDGGAQTFAVAAPTSVAWLGEGEIAVATARSARLVTVFDQRGKVLRQFGDPMDIAGRAELNRFLNIGRLIATPRGELYYAFNYLPEPTVRKYDRYGYAAMEMELTALEFQPTAQAVRREIGRQEEKGSAPTFKAVVTAMGVDPETDDLWLATEGLLVRFDREGNRRATYRIYTAGGAKLEATTILVERERLLIGADPLGVYEFARPETSR
jgi:hypothetical protein